MPPQSDRATCCGDHVDKSALVAFAVGEMGLSNTEDGWLIDLVIAEISACQKRDYG